MFALKLILDERRLTNCTLAKSGLFWRQQIKTEIYSRNSSWLDIHLSCVHLCIPSYRQHLPIVRCNQRTEFTLHTATRLYCSVLIVLKHRYY